MRIGIIGAGFIARGLALHAIRSGHEVMLSNSRGPQTLGSAAAALRCQVGTVDDAARFGDVVFLALPMHAYRSLPVAPLAGKVVADVVNYYPGRDGSIEALDAGTTTTSELIAHHLPGAKLVKAFNAIMANDLEKDAQPSRAPGRRALPIAGDDTGAKAIVATLVDQFGFDVVDAGPLAEGWRFERARPVYCVPLDKDGLTRALKATTRSDFVAEGSWRAR
jgi:predicted dinucleotide-binding enzyme